MRYLAILCLLATPAFADTLNQSGVGNIAQQNVGNVGAGANSPTSVKAYGGNANQHQSQYQKQRQSQSSYSAGGSSSNSYSDRDSASTAYAAPLVASEDACMGSSSAGGQGMGFGLSVGSTWRDGDCVRRKDARELYNMGKKGASLALMCRNEDVYSAMEAAGTPCPETIKPVGRKDEAVYQYPSGRIIH